MPKTPRTAYPSDVSEEEWAFCAPYLVLMREDAPQREHSLREVFNALRWLVRTGAPWRLMPHDLPPWPVVHQQTQRWIRSECFATMAADPRAQHNESRSDAAVREEERKKQVAGVRI